MSVSVMSYLTVETIDVRRYFLTWLEQTAVIAPYRGKYCDLVGRKTASC